MIEDAGWFMHPTSGGKEANIVAFTQNTKPWKGEHAAREVTREDHRLRKMLDVSTKFFKQQPLFFIGFLLERPQYVSL